MMHKVNASVASLTKEIKQHSLKTVQSLLAIGGCLHRLRKLMDRPEFLEHIKAHFSMSEFHAHRLEKLYLKFNKKVSIHVLSSKPSVLYLLATNVSTEKVEVLAKGGKIKVGNQFKKIEQLTVKDMQSLADEKKKHSDPFDVDDDELDLNKAKNAHRRLSTLLEELSDWGAELTRFRSMSIQIENREMVKKYVSETIECLRQLEKNL